MDNAGYVAISVQTALRRSLDVIAHNIANAETTAFKAAAALFVPYVENAGTDREIAFVQDYGLVRDTREGPFLATGAPFDLAIRGDAYFVVDVGGERRYTRNGHFTLSPEGELMTAAGHPVLDVDGRAIAIPPEETDVTIAPDGTLSGSAGQIGRLELVAFAEPQALERAADGLYHAAQTPIEPREALVAQGMLERSNVSPIQEITRMIDVLRTYQSNARLIETEHELTLRSIDDLLTA